LSVARSITGRPVPFFEQIGGALLLIGQAVPLFGSSTVAALSGRQAFCGLPTFARKRRYCSALVTTGARLMDQGLFGTKSEEEL
jgi:hypothetical protein